VLVEEALNCGNRLNKVAREVGVRRSSDDHDERQPSIKDRRPLIWPPADRLVVTDRDPALRCHDGDPILARDVISKMIRMALDPQARNAKRLGNGSSEVAIGEENTVACG
jgi:hypothetical protein